MSTSNRFKSFLPYPSILEKSGCKHFPSGFIRKFVQSPLESLSLFSNLAFKFLDISGYIVLLMYYKGNTIIIFVENESLALKFYNKLKDGRDVQILT